GDALGEAAVAVAQEDRQVAALLVEDGQVEERVAVEAARDDDRGLAAGGEGAGALGIEKAAEGAAIQQREVVGTAVGHNQVAPPVGVEVPDHQAEGSFARVEGQAAVDRVQAGQSTATAELQHGRERRARLVEEDTDGARELAAHHDVRAVVAV